MATQTISIRRTGDRLWLRWGLAGLLGFVGGMTIKTAIEIAADLGGFTAALEGIPAPLFGALFGAMLGLCTGLAQWLALRRKIPGAGAWTAATLAAWSLFWTLHNSVLPFAHSPWGLVLQGVGHGALVGLTIGAAQWLVLRGRVASAGRWVPISTLSWSAAGAFVHFLLDVLLASSNIHGPYDLLLTSVLAALLSGIGLQRLVGAREAGLP